MNTDESKDRTVHDSKQATLLGICVTGNKKAAPASLVNVVPEDDHEMNMQLP